MLGCDDHAAVRIAWSAIEANLRALRPDARFEGCLVQAMARGELEMIVGCRHDPTYGPVVAVGLGGIHTETLEDVQLALAPVSGARALELIRSLRGHPLLAGARGRPPLAVPALADVVERMSWIAATLGPRLIELQANPVLVGRDGVIAVDARGTLAKLP